MSDNYGIGPRRTIRTELATVCAACWDKALGYNEPNNVHVDMHFLNFLYFWVKNNVLQSLLLWCVADAFKSLQGVVSPTSVKLMTLNLRQSTIPNDKNETISSVAHQWYNFGDALPNIVTHREQQITFICVINDDMHYAAFKLSFPASSL